MIIDGFVIQSKKMQQIFEKSQSKFSHFRLKKNQEKSPLKSWWDSLANILFPPDVG